MRRVKVKGEAVEGRVVRRLPPQDGAERRAVRRGSNLLHVVAGGEAGEAAPPGSRLQAYSSLLDGQALLYGGCALIVATYCYIVLLYALCL